MLTLPPEVGLQWTWSVALPQHSLSLVQRLLMILQPRPGWQTSTPLWAQGPQFRLQQAPHPLQMVPSCAQLPTPLVETFPNSKDQYRFGSRVPCVVVGPFAKAKHVSHVQSSHASLVAFIERLFGLPPSPNADAARRTTAATEHALADCVDINQKPLPPV